MDAKILDSYFCPECGKPHEPESRFCRHCGTNLVGDETQAGVSAPKSVPKQSVASMSLEELLASFGSVRKKAYLDRLISFETFGMTEGVGAAYVPDGGGFAPAMYRSTTQTQWIAYEGQEELTDMELFELVGDERLVARGVAHMRHCNLSIVFGVVIIVACAVPIILGAAYGVLTNLPLEMEEILISAGLWSVAFILGIIFVSKGHSDKEKNAVPLNLVAPLADNYNLRLAQKIASVPNR